MSAAPLRHVVQFSTGAGSAEVAWRVVEQYGPESVLLLTADTLVEDADNWRFAQQVVDRLGCEWVRLADGRTPMQVGRDERVVPNNRLAVCSRVLKRDLLRSYLDANHDPANTVIYLGFDWTEPERHERSIQHWAPWRIESPLIQPPYVSKPDLLRLFRSRGIEPPALYAQGFTHANCFHPDTRFITDQGVKTFRETNGQSVRVLGKGGGWKSADVRTFGVQRLWELRLKRYADEKTVLVTGEHLWPRRKAAGRTDFVWTATAGLLPGQRIAGMYGHVRHNVKPSVVGIQAGFVFGDGTADTPASGQVTPARAFFCGPKDKAMLPYFSTSRLTERRDGVTVAHDLPRYWKDVPPLNESQSYLYGWLAGYFAADGTVSHGMARLNSARLADLELVRDVCARLGIGTNPIRAETRLGYGAEPTALYGVALHMSTLRPDFFLIPDHLTKFETRVEGPRPADWQVVGVRETDRLEPVMCAVVPDGNAFTLEDNVYTHNCGGACVRGGQAQWELLHRVNPARYAEWEGEENTTRALLGKDVSVLRDRTGGTSRPLTLTTFRQRIESQPGLFDPDDWGACGCTDGYPVGVGDSH